MVKIPGTQYELAIIDKDSDFVVEVTRVGKTEATLRIRDIIDIESGIREFLEEQGQVVPANRLKIVVDELEEQAYTWVEEEKKQGSKEKLESLMQTTGTGNLKILLMGLSGAGKTSIYRTIFEGKEFWEIRDLPPTRGVQRLTPQSILGSRDQKLFIWDVGGQKTYRDRYHEDPHTLFGNAQGLIFIVDSADANRLEEARVELAWCVETAQKINPDCKIFCFIHKTDLSPDRIQIIDGIKKFLQKGISREIPVYATSVFDQSIYLAWGNAMEQMLPKSKVLNVLAQDLKEKLHVYNVLVIEKRTGLPLCSSQVFEEDEDIMITGLLNKMMVATEKIAAEMDLLNVEKISIELGNGTIFIKEILPFVLLMITASSDKFLQAQDQISVFVEKIKEYL